ncbi:MAG: IS21-like element helper ATPase IstB [Chloroflexota bacterium]|nr:IS21-like element helper ATPase IstB [Chloroflexota bacterium]
MNALGLQPRLKRLKLGGMLQTLELRADQAHTDKLGHLEFLELLLEDEIQRRANKALARRIARARFEEERTLSEFDFAFNPKIPAAQIRDLATCSFIERRESVLLVGPVGVGKTHLAAAIGHAACMQGRSVLFEKTAHVLSDLGAGHLDGTWERRLRRYLAPDLLICDDFGLRAFSERQGEDLYELVSERVRRGSIIVTSNRPPAEWYALFPNPVLAEGALDRLINAAHHVLLEGKSYRPRQRPDVTDRSQGTSSGDVAENEALRSPRTAATERVSARHPRRGR